MRRHWVFGAGLVEQFACQDCSETGSSDVVALVDQVVSKLVIEVVDRPSDRVLGEAIVSTLV